MMRVYKSKDKYWISGLDKEMFVVINDEEFEKESGHLLGENVLIDEYKYTVIGVESWAIPIIPKGAPIALMVSKL